MGCHAPGFVLQLVVGAGSWRQSEIRWKKCIATRICCAGSWSYIILISFLYGIIIVSWSCKMYFLQSAWLQPQPKTSKSTSYKLCSVYIFQEEYQRSHMCLLFGYMIIYYIYILYTLGKGNWDLTGAANPTAMPCMFSKGLLVKGYKRPIQSLIILAIQHPQRCLCFHLRVWRDVVAANIQDQQFWKGSMNLVDRSSIFCFLSYFVVLCCICRTV